MKNTANPNEVSTGKLYSDATVHNDVIYVSGQLPVDPITGEIYQGSISEQTKLIMSRIAEIVKNAGSKMDNLLRTTILLTDMSNYDAVNDAYAQFFTNEPPACVCFQVVALPRGANVEIEAICALH